MNNNVVETFGNRIRVRACGIYVENERVLMVGHEGLIENQLYWSPPGGGIRFGENAAQAVAREIWEECGLEAIVGSFMFLKEFIDGPLHAMELYFHIISLGRASVKPGHDPELPINQQVISDVRFMTLDEIRSLPGSAVDSFFHSIPSLSYLCDGNNWSSIQKAIF